MLELPATPGTSGGMKSPVTPRTMAFNTLGGIGGGGGGGKKGKGMGMGMGMGKKGRVQELRSGGEMGGIGGRRELPLRHHISMGDETYNGK